MPASQLHGASPSEQDTANCFSALVRVVCCVRKKREETADEGHRSGAVGPGQGALFAVLVGRERPSDHIRDPAHLFRCQVGDGAEGFFVAPFGRRFISLGLPSSPALVLQPSGQVPELIFNSSVGSGDVLPQTPGSCAAPAVGRFFDVSVACELPQVKRAETRAVAQPGGGFGRCEGADFGEQAQQGCADRVLS